MVYEYTGLFLSADVVMSRIQAALSGVSPSCPDLPDKDGCHATGSYLENCAIFSFFE